jgi:hypothetical protein
MARKSKAKMPKRSRAMLSNPQSVLDSSSYSGQGKWTFRLVGTSAVASSTVTTGVSAVQFTISTATIPGYGTRFAATFDEVRFLKVHAKIRPLATTTGVTRFWWDELALGTPTATQASERLGLTLPNNSSSTRSVVSSVWKAQNLSDLAFSSTAAPAAAIHFYLYTDNANFGAPIVVTPLWLIEFDIDVEFRGLSSA